MKRNTVKDIATLYKKEEKIVCLALYDSTMASFADYAEIDLILVGDSLGMTMLGYDSTIPVTINQSLHHTAAVVRGSRKALVIGDMPFLTYHCGTDNAIINAGRYMQEAGASGVKIEGGIDVAPTVKRMVQAGIPVMGHIGILPQSVKVEGGYAIKGKNENDVNNLLEDALALQEAGVFSIVLEGIKKEASIKISKALNIPTIGIGASVECGGQIQVIHDILGLFEAFAPKHAKKYLHLANDIKEALGQYTSEVKKSIFPTDENTF